MFNDTLFYGDRLSRLRYNCTVKTPTRLDRSFFDQDTLTVARQLLGLKLIKIEGPRRLGGIITETEAYRGETDGACHARAGRTPRTQVMYGPPGFTYVYFNYGIHWLLNFVTESDGFPAAVLIRGIEPTEGLDIIAARRADRPKSQWTDGPAKLCQALNIDQNHNNRDSCDPNSTVFIEIGAPIPDSRVTIGPRVGLNKVLEPWKSIPWRFQLKK